MIELKKLRLIIREEVKKSLNEGKEIGGYYLMKQIKDQARDAKRSGEKKVAKALMFLYSRINQSARDVDLSADDLNDFLNDPRARKYARDLPDWMIDDLFEGVNKKLKEYMIKGVEIKDFVDAALKKSGIKVTKYLPMKSGWLGGKFVWGAFYTVQANKRKDILPFTVDKKGNLHLNVSPNKFIVGKIGKTSQIIKTLKDFKKSDLDVEYPVKGKSRND